MLARFFRFRVNLKPFASPPARVSLRAFEPSASPDPTGDTHSDYDRHPLRIQELDHLVAREGDGRRFNVHLFRVAAATGAVKLVGSGRHG